MITRTGLAGVLGAVGGPAASGLGEGVAALAGGEGVGSAVANGLVTGGGTYLGGRGGEALAGLLAGSRLGPVAQIVLPYLGKYLGARMTTTATPLGQSQYATQKEAFEQGQQKALFETRSKLKDKLRAKMNGVGWKEESKAPSLAKPK